VGVPRLAGEGEAEAVSADRLVVVQHPLARRDMPIGVAVAQDLRREQGHGERQDRRNGDQRRLLPRRAEAHAADAHLRRGVPAQMIDQLRLAPMPAQSKARLG
jgi:hypothetical protein